MSVKVLSRADTSPDTLTREGMHSCWFVSSSCWQPVQAVQRHRPLRQSQPAPQREANRRQPLHQALRLERCYTRQIGRMGWMDGKIQVDGQSSKECFRVTQAT